MRSKDRMEEYLLGRLTEQHRADFEQELVREPKLCQELEQMRQIVTAFEKRGEQTALAAMQGLAGEDELKRILRDADKKSASRQHHRRLYFAIATAAAVLIAGWFGVQPKYGSTQLYSQYFVAQQYDLAPSRGGDDVAEDSVIYLAIDLANKGESERAIELLNTIAQDDYAQLQDDARWNIALIYLGIDDRLNAKLALRTLADNQSEYTQKAKQLLDKIEKRRWF